MGHFGDPDVPSDRETDDSPRPLSPVEKMLNALDELQDAMKRLAAENRIVGHDFALVEPFSREDAPPGASHPQAQNPTGDSKTALD
jgi:hypothetical protein